MNERPYTTDEPSISTTRKMASNCFRVIPGT